MPNRFYWDAPVFLAWIKNEAGRSAHIQAFLEDAKKELVEILTSMVSIVEVSNGVAQVTGQRDLVAETAIDALWLPPSPIQVVEFYRQIGEDARYLMRRAVELPNMKLTPLDAIHLATAKRMGAEVVHTYDQPLMAWSAELGLPIEEPITPRPPLFSGNG